MDSELRAEIKRVFALDDAVRAEYEDWQRRQEAKAQSRIIRKTYQTPPQPNRGQPLWTMDSKSGCGPLLWR